MLPSEQQKQLAAEIRTVIESIYPVPRPAKTTTVRPGMRRRKQSGKNAIALDYYSKQSQ